MCGFAGIFQFVHAMTGIDTSVLHRMGDILRHRGPDDEGLYISDDRTVGFAFRRLSIIDLSPGGHQPMSNADGSIWIVFNGEIYNHSALRNELEPKGYVYRSQSDTETIIYAYQEWGERFVEKLEGMFAIALWDSHKQQMFLYRDRIGIKPLYYSTRHDQVIFASEIKAILQHPAMSREVDETALYHYLTFIHTPAPDTLFSGITKLEPATYLRISKDGSFKKQCYWDPLQQAPASFDYSDEEGVKRRITTLFSEAVSKRMMSDVPFGVFLSGGIDSSANVAFMSRLMDRPVDTFTVAIQGQEDTNEFQWARKISKLFKTNHHEILIDDSHFLDLLPTIIYHQDEPLADPVCFPLYYVSKLARDNGTIVVQVGEGSDEQFAGYSNYLLAERLARYARGLGPIPKALTGAAYSLLKPYIKSRKSDYRQNIVKNLLNRQPVFWGNAIAFYEEEKKRLLSEQYRQRSAGLDSYSIVERTLASMPDRDKRSNLQKIIYWELKNRLAELLLMRVDKITMAQSIEARVPFLDHKLVEFSMQIPSALKRKHGVTKYILKEALRGILPDEIIERKKIGFAGSGKNMLTPEIFAHAKSLLLGSKHEYFDKEYIRALLTEYEQSKINYTPQIWMLYNFELWYRWWILGKTSF
jgi:asparagine synthase (glutamine-hydrolysing)